MYSFYYFQVCSRRFPLSVSCSAVQIHCPECQQEILRFKFTVYGFEDADDDLIEEIFFRLNNSAPLSKPQKAMPLCGVANAKFIKSLLADRFFSDICQFSALQRRKSDDMCTLLQSMMLLDNRYEGYEFSSISADEVMRYAAHIKHNYSEKQKERLFDIIDYLEKVFPEKDKMVKKINIPVLVLVADTAMGKEYNAVKNVYRVGPMYFRQWFSYFCDECYDGYKQYCSSGSIKKEKTLKRIEIMEQSFREYFELEEQPAMEQDADSSRQPEKDTAPDPAPQENGTPLQDAAPEDEPSKVLPVGEILSDDTSSMDSLPQKQGMEEGSVPDGQQELPAVTEGASYMEDQP